MNDLDKILTSSLVLTTAIADALVAKGVITKQDLLNSLTVLSYDSPFPPQVFQDLRAQIEKLSDS